VLLNLAPSLLQWRLQSASTDYEVLLSVPEPEVDKLVKADPLAQAKLRGIEAKKRLLSAEGGMLSTQEVASALTSAPRLSTASPHGQAHRHRPGPQPTPFQPGGLATIRLLASRGFLMS